MPIIPNVPGVPSLRSYSPQAFVLLAADALRALTGISFNQWGIYRYGLPVIIADNQLSFEFKRDFSISDYPTEQGGFQSYNKVQLPTDIRCRFSAGGSTANRQAFLASIDAIIATTDLYDVVTPEAVYLSYCFEHQDFRRSAKQGVGLIEVDVWLKEVRLTATSIFSNTQQPGVAGQQAIGNVQPQTPSAQVLAGPLAGGFF